MDIQQKLKNLEEEGCQEEQRMLDRNLSKKPRQEKIGEVGNGEILHPNVQPGMFWREILQHGVFRSVPESRMGDVPAHWREKMDDYPVGYCEVAMKKIMNLVYNPRLNSPRPRTESGEGGENGRVT